MPKLQAIVRDVRRFKRTCRFISEAARRADKLNKGAIMIADALSNLSRYESAVPRLREVVRFLAGLDLSSLKTGRYDIAGDDAYMNVMEYATFPEAERKWESHRKYIDVQIILRGSEYMGYCPASLLGDSDPYSEENDAVIYSGDCAPCTRVFAPENNFVVFFPGEAHRPCCESGTDRNVLKAVIKIKA
jgi:YhcH/YjgK/YiaL family protein